MPFDHIDMASALQPQTILALDVEKKPLGVTPVFTRHDFVTTSCRAAISFVVRECRSAGD
jgi:hypothetical protein